MPTQLLTTKLYIPPVRPELVSRPHLIERLNQGLDRKLTLISAPAGFGKTTLLSEWVHTMGRATPPTAVAWLSLDEGDSDLTRFLAYLVAALQTAEGTIGLGMPLLSVNRVESGQADVVDIDQSGDSSSEQKDGREVHNMA